MSGSIPTYPYIFFDVYIDHSVLYFSLLFYEDIYVDIENFEEIEPDSKNYGALDPEA